MGRRANHEVWRKQRGELLAEEQDGALAREGRGVRQAFAPADGWAAGTGIRVRWGLAEDGAKVARLLELNGMPRWVAFEDRFVVVEVEGEVTAAMRYQTGSGRLLLSLLVADPWCDEGALARALYSGSRTLAWEAGIPEVVARGPEDPRRAREAGFRRRGRDLRANAAAEAMAVPDSYPPPGSPLRRTSSLWGRLGVPFFGTTRDSDEAGR